MHAALRRLGLTIVVGLLAAGGAGATEYQFTDLGTLGGRRGSAHGINASGQVVGVSGVDGPVHHATLWQDGDVFDLGTLGGLRSWAVGINDAGTIVGAGEIPEAGRDHAARWDAGVATDLGTLGGHQSSATAINAGGTVAGYSEAPDGVGHATRWEAGAIVDLGTGKAWAINDAGVVVGTGRHGHATRWFQGKTTDLGVLGGIWSEARGVNNAGVIVGSSTTEGNAATRATRWHRGTITDLGTLGGNSSFAFAVNDAGQIVGSSESWLGLDDHYRATLWQHGKVIDLNKRLDTATRDAGWVLKWAMAINRDGAIVGIARNKKLGVHQHAFLLTPLPPPTRP